MLITSIVRWNHHGFAVVSATLIQQRKNDADRP